MVVLSLAGLSRTFLLSPITSGRQTAVQSLIQNLASVAHSSVELDGP